MKQFFNKLFKRKPALQKLDSLHCKLSSEINSLLEINKSLQERTRRHMMWVNQKDHPLTSSFQINYSERYLLAFDNGKMVIAQWGVTRGDVHLKTMQHKPVLGTPIAWMALKPPKDAL